MVSVGTFNVRYITTEEDEQNNWENRKGRVVRSIRENDCDILGLQECSPLIQTDLSDQLGSTYDIRYFSPSVASGSGSGGQANGLAYKKDRYTLDDWHFFWLLS